MAVQKDLPLDYPLYWTNKISPPLRRLLEPALSKKQLDELFSGKHTQVKFSKASTGVGKMGSFFKPKTDDVGKSPEKQREKDKQRAAQKASEDICRACQVQSSGEWLCSNKSCDNLFERLRKLDW